ncbi:hypothetical protein [Actinoplanes subglobosus]|uniref:DUF3558 domain-containing protein n=1 Tax=Actinoplanes subglobosus TaxID=1547892 RepID=A0ABV8J6A2_9ACTN
MIRSWSILLAGAGLAALTGCTAGDQPTPPPPSATVSAPVMPAYFASLGTTCPTLDSPESARFTRSQPGRWNLLPEKSDIIDWVDCGWRPKDADDSEAPPWVTVNIRIHLDSSTPHKSAYEYAERDFTRSRDEAMTRAGRLQPGVVRVAERDTPSGPAVVVADVDDAEITKNIDELRQTTRVGNLLVTVMLFEAKDAGGGDADKMMAELPATADAITAEVLEHMAKQQTATA